MKVFCSLLVVIALGCTQQTPVFKHDLDPGHTPWTAAPQPVPDDKFTFAIVSDLNGGERAGIFEVAIAQLNLLQPVFVLSVGDLVDGGTEDTLQLKREYDHFDSMAAKLKMPFFLLGGNHDLTNRAMQDYWAQRYGRTYYYFMYDNVLFLMVNSEDYSEQRMQQIYQARAKAIEVLEGPNPELAQEMEYFKMPERVSGEISPEQSAYFEKVIKENPDVRWTFVLMHKPVWQRDAENNLSGIENALKDRNYTVINGHFHAYSHTIKNGHDYMILGTTGGSQNPESVMAFDHVTLVSMMGDGPSIANLRLDGILDKTGHIPLHGDTLCFQTSQCMEQSFGK